MSVLFFILFSSLPFLDDFPFEKAYDLLDEGSLIEISEMLDKLESYDKNARTQAFIGALWTKKASLASEVKDKIGFFKKGAEMLENEINQDPDEVEYRFLRLAVQENSPAILGYKNNLDEDKQVILNNFLSLDKSLRNQIISYSKNSQIILHSELPN